MTTNKRAKKKPAPPRRRVARRNEAQEAARQYREANQDIAFAVEAMRTARLGHQVRIEHFGRRIYRVFS